MFPSPATVRWSRMAALSGAVRRASLPARNAVREAALERLRPVLDGDEPVGVLGVREQPRPEPSRVAIGDSSAAFELEHGTFVRRRLVPKPAGHPQMDEKRVPARETNDDVLAPPLDRVDAIAGEHGRNGSGILGARQTRVVDARGENPPPHNRVGEPPALGLDLRQLRHGLRRDDRLAGDAARRRLAAEPRVHGRADVGELALVDLAGGVPPLDVGEQETVLARVV